MFNNFYLNEGDMQFFQIKFQLSLSFFLIIGYSLLIFNPIKASTNQRNPNDGEQKKLMAGASIGNITPLLGDMIVGGWTTREAVHIHDELFVRCLVLDDGANKLVFIVADVLGLQQVLVDAAKRSIEERMNIPTSNIIISATHTHSAASVMGTAENWCNWNIFPFEEYQNLFIRRLIDCVQIAINNLELARIGWGVVSLPEHVFVRRWKMKEPIINPFGEYDEVLMNPGFNNNNKLTPASEPDPDLSFISVQSKGGRPIAILANYSLHYVGGLPGNHISADYFAIFSDRIQELLNADRQDPPFVGIMTNGTSGDVNNINFSEPEEKNAPYSKMQYVGRDIAQKVFEVYKTITYRDCVPLSAKEGGITLKVRKPDKKMIERAKTILERNDSIKPLHLREKVYAERTFRQMKRPDQVIVPIQVFGIGDLGVASIPFEVFAEIGLEIKAKSPFEKTFVIGLAGGYYGYLPTPAQHKLGGYETWLCTSNVEIEASEKIVFELMKLFSSIKKQ